jgi:hypothetical protein
MFILNIFCWMIPLEVQLFANPYSRFGTRNDAKPASLAKFFVDSDKTLFQKYSPILYGRKLYFLCLFPYIVNGISGSERSYKTFNKEGAESTAGAVLKGRQPGYPRFCQETNTESVNKLTLAGSTLLWVFWSGCKRGTHPLKKTNP